MTRREWLEEAERWQRQAEHNREVAVHDRAGGFHSAACFWAQQAAEVGLKAFLYARGFDVRGHSVADLAQQAAELDPGDSDRAVELAGKVLDLVSEKIGFFRAWLERAEQKKREHTKDVGGFAIGL